MVLITDEMIAEAQRHNKDLRMELAIALYTSQVFDARKSAEIAGVLWMNLDDEIAKRGIEPWDVMTPEEFAEQYETFRKHYFKQW